MRKITKRENDRVLVRSSVHCWILKAALFGSLAMAENEARMEIEKSVLKRGQY